MIRAFKFVDPSLLSPEHLRKMREKWQGRRALEPKVIRFGTDASFSTGVEEEVLVHEGCSLREFNQGLDAVLLVLVQVGSADALAIMADRLAWRMAVASYEGLTPDEQLLYMREFMFKYQGEAMSRNWASKFTTDIQLLLMVSRKGTALAATRAKESKVRDEAPPGGQAWGKRAKHADIQSQAGGGRQRRGWDNDRAEGGDRRHPNKGKRSRSPHRRRSRSPARAKAMSPSKAHGVGKAGKGVCKSRLFAGNRCKFPKCRFSHVCPCCNSDHEDAEKGCKAWNEAVAKKVADEFNLRP
jgi:hypothetical protein